MRLLLVVIFLIFPCFSVLSSGEQQQQQQPLPIQSCADQVPWGWPQVIVSNSTGICRHGYVLLHDNSAKIPVWAAYTLTPDHAIGCVKRSNAFAADQSLPQNGRSTPQDYVGTGFDQGHQVPDGDQSWNPLTEHESFIMSNMAPQYPHTNRGNWKFLESSIRAWVYEQNQPYTIYVGPVYNGNDPKIGTNLVTVPHAFFKIVINDTTHQVAGWIFPNISSGGSTTNIVPLRVPVAQIQQITGIQFSYPPNSVELSAGSEWPVDFGAFTKAKQKQCGAYSSSDSAD
jgi:endonuclease G